MITLKDLLKRWKADDGYLKVWTTEEIIAEYIGVIDQIISWQENKKQIKELNS